MAVSPRSLTDLVNWTRATEYRKGGYVDLSEPLPDYPLWNNIIQREVIRSTPTIRVQIVKKSASSRQVYQVGQAVQTSANPLSESYTLAWGGNMWSTVYYPHEQAFNNLGSADEIIDVVQARKVQFDAEPRRDFELLLAAAVNDTSKDDLLGVRHWLPPDTTATDLELNGGADITASEYLSGPTVAALPEWGHAVCGFDTLQNDLLTKIDEFIDRVNYFQPDGSLNLIPGSPNRIGLLNQVTYSQWKDLQDVANDNLKDDLGLWRSAVHYRSVPFINLPAWTESTSVKPSGSALVAVLDMNAIRLWVHKDFNFLLYPAFEDFNDGGIKQKREAWCQLAFLSRRNHLMAYTTQANFTM